MARRSSLAAALVLAVVALLAPAEAKGSKGVRRNSALHGKPRKKGRRPPPRKKKRREYDYDDDDDDDDDFGGGSRQMTYYKPRRKPTGPSACAAACSTSSAASRRRSRRRRHHHRRSRTRGASSSAGAAVVPSCAACRAAPSCGGRPCCPWPPRARGVLRRRALRPPRGSSAGPCFRVPRRALNRRQVSARRQAVKHTRASAGLWFPAT